MYHMVMMERCDRVPESLTGKGHDSPNEWIVCVRCIRRPWEDEDHLMKFFFDNEDEARGYKEDVERLITSVIKLEKQKVMEKFEKVLYGR